MANMGWICLYREIRDNWIWEDKEPFDKRSAWIDLLLMVNHEDKKILFDNELITVKRGQTITSLTKLSERWRWSRKKVKSFLEILEKDGMVSVQIKARKRTTINVVNYSVYQDRGTTEEPQKNHRRTTEEPQRNINNNDNNDNNDNKMIDISSKLQNNIETEKNDRYRFIERFKELTDKTINYQSILNIPAKSLEPLLKEIEQSEYLKKNLTIQFAAKNLEKILSGKYRDFKSGRKNNNKFNNFESTLQEYDLEAIAKRKRDEFFKEIGD